MQLIYETTENGYYILKDGKRIIHQYEPYIPYPELGYEGSAKKQIEEIYEQIKNPAKPYTQEQYDAVLESLIAEGRL